MYEEIFLRRRNHLAQERTLDNLCIFVSSGPDGYSPVYFLGMDMRDQFYRPTAFGILECKK